MTVQRNNGALEVGSTACRCAQPDVTGLAGHAVHERELLRGLIEVLEATAAVIAAVVTPPAWKRSTVHASVVKAVEPLPVEHGAQTFSAASSSARRNVLT